MKQTKQDTKLKAYKAAKTPRDMVESWAPVAGAGSETLHKVYKVYEEKAPKIATEMLKSLIQEPEIKLMERGILEPRVTELTRLAIAVQMNNTARVTHQVVAAKAIGVSDEAIIDCVWLASYALAKSYIGGLGPALRMGSGLAQKAQTKQKYEAAIKSGQEGIFSHQEEVEKFKEASDKTPMDMLTSWSQWFGMTPEDAAALARDPQSIGVFAAFDELSPGLGLVKDFFHDPLINNYARWWKGEGLETKDKDRIEWMLCAAQQAFGAIAFHLPFMYARGFTEEQMMELWYLLGIELHRTILERVGPALDEGFQQAARLGLAKK
jgi:alkylhydroperoxidase/carboxymuconolactone decarboxylase family protein YurZ